MLTASPWNRFPLRVMIFSEQVSELWEEAKWAKGVVRTEAARRKWNLLRETTTGGVTVNGKSKGKGKAMVDEVIDHTWEAREKMIEKVEVIYRFEGVDGKRLAREVDDAGMEVDGPDKLVVNDGTLDDDSLQNATNFGNHDDR